MFSHLLSISLNNTLSRGLHSSRRVTLQTWITTGPHSIWSSNGIRPNGHPAYVLSAEFRRIMRPIAFRIYDCLSRDGRGYQYPDFHKSIYIIDNKDVKKVPAATAKPTPKKEPKTPVTPKVQPSEGSKTLFVGKLPFTVERAGIENVFKEVGEVVDIRFALHPEGGTKGYGHDKFASAADAKKVLENMNGLALFGRALKLGLAAERGAYTPQSRGFERNSFQRAEGVEGTSIFIHGLDTNDDEYKTKNALREHFGSCGEISGISVPKDPEGYIKGKEDDV